ncbi:SdrD B-like domain-containing protein [Saccharomonospora iraqiensis]|uniref:SdrD B-like domain-containing protein n=1 Tax=Saccharomonospora iraqiensis TaxID=52698 RepID=UPI0004004BAC|nr:SdrD B-like domain-containing protein [Saccharomonospora iraqiensis]
MLSRRSGRRREAVCGAAAVLALGIVTAPVSTADETSGTTTPGTTTAETTGPDGTTGPGDSTETPGESSSEESSGEQPADEAPEDPPADAAPDLAVSATVPDQTYLIGDDVPVTVTISNVGDATAEEVTGHFGESDGFEFFAQSDEWGEFDRFDDGGTLAAGESAELEVTGKIQDWDGRTGPELSVWVQAPGDVGPGNDEATVALSVVPPSTTGTIGGVLYGDANANDEVDPGEGLGGVELRIPRHGSPEPGTTTTDADGSFAFTEVPAGVYTLRVTHGQTSWVVPATTDIRVDGSGQSTDLEIRGERPLSDVLGASIDFDDDTYAPGDLAHATITLTNDGSEPLTGIKAGCNRAGSGLHLDGTNTVEHFGDLAADGVTVGAGETETFAVTGIVPDSAADNGYVPLICDFGPSPGYPDGYPSAYAYADVPGKTAEAAVLLGQDRDGDRIIDEDGYVADTTVGLLDPDTGEVIRTAVTDDDGRAEFGEMPVGLYRPAVYGPWRFADADDGNPVVRVSTWYDGAAQSLTVVPGPDKPLPGEGGDGGENPITDEPPEPSLEEPPQDNSAGLASTGVNAVTLGGAGLAALLAGAGAVLLTRRRRAGT